jgi:hypothetical protein
MSNIQELAQSFSDDLIQKTRTNGDIFFTHASDGDDLMSVIHAGHDDQNILPDDYRYQFIKDALDAIAETDDIESAMESACDPDVYSRELTGWLHSSVGRLEYVTEAVKSFGADTGFQILANAQYLERQEVFYQVISALKKLVESGE